MKLGSLPSQTDFYKLLLLSITMLINLLRSHIASFKPITNKNELILPLLKWGGIYKNYNWFLISIYNAMTIIIAIKAYKFWIPNGLDNEIDSVILKKERKIKMSY